MSSTMNRRCFLGATVAATASVGLSPRQYARVLGANERLNIGVIGVAGRGGWNLAGVAAENIVALCDVDKARLNGAASRHPEARKFFDYRRLLELPGLDAAVVSTPDHHHAPAAVRALRRGLHVYCEKPLTHTVAEARLLTRLAAETGKATQMGTQNHEHPGYRRTVELLRAGAIGPVREVHVITDRPGRWWPQGLSLPSGKPAVPTGLHWDLWLGPAPSQAYQAAYVPFRWRGWWDFGCGAIGDMAIHLMDPAFWALKLGGKVKVCSEGPAALSHCGPKWMKTHFAFGARGDLPPVDVHWYEGETKPRPEIAADLPMNGSLFIGDAGRLAIAHGADAPRLLPEENFADFVPPPPSLPESPGHHQQWIAACKTGSATGSAFSYAGPFTEVVLLGNVAFRAGGPITFDPVTMSIDGPEGADRFLQKSYREGWAV